MRYMIFLGLLALVAASGGYYYWKNTPEYALNQIKSAVEDKNRLVFETHVDVERVIVSAIDEFAQTLLEDQSDGVDADKYGALAKVFSAEMAQAVTPQLEQLVETEIEKSFEKEKSQESLQYLGHNKERCGEEACYFKIQLLNTRSGGEVFTRAKLEKIQGVWKVTALPGLAQKIKKYRKGGLSPD